MSDIPWFKALSRIIVVATVGLAVSLFAGTLVSFIPTSPLEGLNAGILTSGTLLVLFYFLLLRTRGTFKPKAWIFSIHSILGLATGILLSVIFLSGVLLLFRGEIELFTNPWLEVETSDSYTSVDEWLDAIGTRTDLSSSRRVDISWPDSSNYPVRIKVNGSNGSESFFINPYDARIQDGELRSGMDWVRNLHTDLTYGTPGHWLTGLVALAAVWLCIGGLTMGRNVFRDWYRVRWTKGLSLLLSDIHKRIGLWLLPFIALNAFAGMLAALFGVLSTGPVEARFGGSYGALYDAVGSPQSVVRSEYIDTPPLDEFIAIAKGVMPGAAIRQMRIIGYNDQNAIVSIRASQKGSFAPRGAGLVMNIRATTREVLLQKEIAKAGIFERVSMAFTAFHFAAYGGSEIRLLHAITALVISLLPFIGLALWFLRRRRIKDC